MREARSPGLPALAHDFAEKFTLDREIRKRPGITSRPFLLPESPMHDARNQPPAATSAPSPSYGMRVPSLPKPPSPQFLCSCASVSRALTRSFHAQAHPAPHSKNIRVQVWACEPSNSTLIFVANLREAPSSGRPVPALSRCEPVHRGHREPATPRRLSNSAPAVSPLPYSRAEIAEWLFHQEKATPWKCQNVHGNCEAALNVPLARLKRRLAARVSLRTLTVSICYTQKCDTPLPP